MKKIFKALPFFALLWFFALGNPIKLIAQATAGYTKINTSAITATTYTTGVIANGTTANYEVTGVNAAGESGPSNIVTVTIPTTGSGHTITFAWTTGTNDASYNLYSETVAPANPPGALSFTVN